MQRGSFVLTFLFAGILPLSGQSGAGKGMTALSNSSGSAVPSVVRFSGKMQELDGTISSGVQNAVFALYKDQADGIPLWSETQTVLPDNHGQVTILLGSASSLGIPAVVFAGGEPRWIGITPNDGIERPRVELVSVPYALKAADAETLGGKRPQEFVSLQQLNSMLVDRKPLGTASSPLSISLLPFESSLSQIHANLLSGSSDHGFAKLMGRNLFSERQSFWGGIEMPASDPEASTPGAVDSAPLDFESLSRDPRTNSSVKQRFRWASQPLPGLGISARLSLLFGANKTTPAETGLSINSDGTINFAPGQELPASAVASALQGQNGVGVGGSGAEVGGTPIVNTVGYSWNQTPPHAAPLQVGTNSVTMIPCPRGVNGADVWHYLYVAGTGTPEVALITGGSCTSRAPSGTLEFTTKYTHPIGYSIGSATDGVQEAVIDASVPSTGGQLSRQVLIDPGSHLFRARLSIRSSGVSITASGATITCAMNDSCIMLGDPSNANLFASIVLHGLRVAAGVPGGTWAAVEDNANGSTIDNLAPTASSTSGASFGSLIQIDNDQAATVTNFTANPPGAVWARCDTSFCSAAITGPGPFHKNAGVLWVQNSNISLQCIANGIDNQNGNTVHVSNAVVQGYAQFGIRARTVYNPITAQLDSVYFEEDGLCNPLGTGAAGLIVEGGKVISNASNPAGMLPQFTNTGATQYLYYLVVHSSTMGTSPVYLFGYANTDGAGPIKLLWNQIGTAGVITYDILRQVGRLGSAATSTPYGTGDFAVATGVLASLCLNRVCSLIDDAGSVPASYTVSDVTNYWPAQPLWPADIVLTTVNDYQNTGGGVPTQYFADSVTGGSAGVVNSAGASQPSVFAQQCDPQSNWSAIWMQCVGGNAVSNDYPPVVATVIQQSVNGGAAGGLKGRLIFEMPPSSGLGPTEVITLGDSNPDKTMATPGNRPNWDSNDTFIGLDQPYALPSSWQLALGSPAAISGYVGTVPDGVHYLERLTSARKQYRVPISLVSITFSTLPALPDGTLLYCLDCRNVHDDGAMFDSAADGGGHGTNLLHENGQWRVH